MQPTPVPSARSRWFGDRAFYAAVLAIIVPVIIQNTITNFVSLLDNLMVGQVGTNEMSGVAIANQLMFVYSLCIFGSISGPGIYAAQFFGAHDLAGVRRCMRMKLIVSIALSAAAILLFLTAGDRLLTLYLSDGSDAAARSETFRHGMAYLRIMLIGLIPFALSQTYASSLRETGATVLPMGASLIAVFTNLVFNWLLIFGRLGFPRMGVEGAAVATVISRFAELTILIVASHTQKSRYPFLTGLYRTMRVPLDLVRKVVRTGLPLLFNESFWALGMAMITQAYSVRGLAVVASQNISGTISNLFWVVFISMGNAIAIMAGHSLGAERIDEARQTVRRIIVFGLLTCVVMGSAMFLAAPLITSLYNTTDTVRGLAVDFLRISACCMFIFCFAHCSYFALRAGGRTAITLVFDSGFTCLIEVPLAMALVHWTALDIRLIYTLCTVSEILKCILGYILLKTDIWTRNLVAQEAAADREAV